MDKRIRFYVSRKNPLTWLMALCMVASAVVLNCAGLCERNGQQRICLGPGGPPAAACLLFALICLLNGQERYF